MYTEENEFDYNDYQTYDDYNDYVDENSNLNKKSFFNKSFFIKLLIIIVAIVLIIFIIFSIKNRNNQLVNNDNSIVVFDNNIAMIREAAEEYFFKNNNLPSDVGSVSIVTVNDLIENDLLTEIKDHDGKLCGYKTSYTSLTRNKNEYVMKVYLSCESLQNGVTYYYDLEGNCLNCNGENYEPDLSTDNDSINNNESNNQNSNQNNDSSSSLVCGNWSEWSTEKKDDAKLEKEERKVIVAYRQDIVYGPWSEWSKEIVSETNNLEIETKQENVTREEYTSWSKYSKTKPSSKDGRVIDTKSEKESYQSCSNKTFTDTYDYWLNDSCKRVGLGEYSCTYTKKVCTTKYKTVTYYRYKDLKLVEELTTFYRFREVSYAEPIYTGYILESEIPDGYQKLAGSEVTQYRYREKCSK